MYSSTAPLLCFPALSAGWYHFNTSFFKAVWIKDFWWKARKACRDLGGDLASIASERENEFVRQVFRIPHWSKQHNGTNYYYYYAACLITVDLFSTLEARRP